MPYLDIDIKYFDLSIRNRDKTGDQITIEAAAAVKQHKVGVKCPTINSMKKIDMIKLGLKKTLTSPNVTMRKQLGGGTLFREPIMIKG